MRARPRSGVESPGMVPSDNSGRHGRTLLFAALLSLVALLHAGDVRAQATQARAWAGGELA